MRQAQLNPFMARCININGAAGV